MDDLVRQALLRWPNVPAIAGWLKLSRRGEWLLTGEVATGLPITHDRMRRFIDRNYEHDENGRWFFQNGPQKVFVALDYTPHIFGLHRHETGYCLVSHTRAVSLPTAVFMDEHGVILFNTPIGVGLLQNNDMDQLASMIVSLDPSSTMQLNATWALPSQVLCDEQEWRLPSGLHNVVSQPLVIQTLARADVPTTFQFVQNPTVYA